MKKYIKWIAALVLLAIIFIIIGFFANLQDNTITFEPITGTENIVQPVKVGYANIYFIKTQDGYILVDAGMIGSENALDEVFSRLNIEPASVSLIITTHGHLDHVGSLAYAKKITGAKLLCHQSLVKYLLDGEVEPAKPRNTIGRILNYLSGAKVDQVTPDIPIKEVFDLEAYGIAGKIIPTPGHSKASITIILDNGEAIVGDMIRDEGKGKIGLGMFYEDEQLLIKSLEKVASFQPRIIYLSHGNRIDFKTFQDAMIKIKEYPTV